MAKKYEPIEDEPVMASEPDAAYRYSSEYQSHITVVTADDDDVDIGDIVFDDNRFYISDDELRRLGRECVDAPGISGEEAIRHFMSMQGMANVIWTDTALALADDCLIYSKEEFGEKAKNKLKVAFANITKRLMHMPRIGPLDDVFKDEDGEYRFLHANRSIKVCYRVIDEEHVKVFAVLHVKMSPRKQKAYL